MDLKKGTLLASYCTLLMVSTNHLVAQEREDNSLDTLTRVVQNITDDLSKIKRLKITGYMQPQWQYIDSAGAPSFAGGDFSNTGNPYYSRFTMRRGRFKFTYNYKNVEFMLNTDATEKGLAMRETFVKITDTWVGMFSLTAGLLQDQFGFELTQSSSVRETPERARYNQTLFPTERDLGIFGTVQFPKASALAGLRVDVAAMNGSAGVSPEFDSHKDFTGRIQYTKTTVNEKSNFALGASYYNGGYRIGNVKDYKFNTSVNGNDGFVFASDTANYNRVAKRLYMGVDAQLTVDWMIGITTLRAEYIQGEQPGTSKSTKSPGIPPTSAIYHRNFNGAYFYFIQNIGHSKFEAVLKYDWYDPNVKIAGKEIGKPTTNTSLSDIRFDTYGVGLNYRMHANIRLMMYYDLVKNENTSIKQYETDIKDNVLTVRMQFKF
jgi:phosphate-selective porin